MLTSWSYVIGITGSGVPAATQMTGYRANLTAQPLGGDRRGLGVGIEGLDVGCSGRLVERQRDSGGPYISGETYAERRLEIEEQLEPNELKGCRRHLGAGHEFR